MFDFLMTILFIGIVTAGLTLGGVAISQDRRRKRDAAMRRHPSAALPLEGTMHLVTRKGDTLCGIPIVGHTAGVAPFTQCQGCYA